jgi:hypothetical protein
MLSLVDKTQGHYKVEGSGYMEEGITPSQV